MALSGGKTEALRQILQNLANDEDVPISSTITAVIGLLGEDSQITLRDQFAMAAMTGAIYLTNSLNNPPDGLMAELAYSAADAMLEYRKK